MKKPAIRAVDKNAPSTPSASAENIPSTPSAPAENIPSTPSAPEPTPSAPDPFDLSSLRLNPSFIETSGVKKLLTTVPVRRPHPQEYFRVYPMPEYRENFAMIELKEDREHFLVRPELIPALASEVVYKTVYTCINRQGVLFLWPVRLPTPDDRKSEWWRSAHEAAEKAMGAWVRIKANMSLGAYEIFVSEKYTDDPALPELTYQELLRIGFRECMVTALDHAVVKRLRGL